MSVSKTARRLVAGLGVLAISGLLTAGLMTAPAAATDDNNLGSIDTSVTTVVDDLSVQTESNDNTCSGGICERINWCAKPGDKQPTTIQSDAPLVLLGKDGTPPPCIKRPKIDKIEKCCVNGLTDVKVPVANGNVFPFRIKVGVDDGAPLIKWVPGNSTVVFEFTGLSNGEHTIHSAVWVGGSTWCKFKDKVIRVWCASPSPSTSPSPSVTPSPSISETEQPPPGDQLPRTGAPVAGIAAGGLAIALGGVGLLVLARRRRDLGTTVE